MTRPSISIHASPSITWQGAAAVKMQHGLKAIGLDANITQSRTRESDTAILMGTTLWTGVEDGNYLLVDRASFKDPEFVSLVWNGHGRRGNHMVPEKPLGRWERMGVEILPWRNGNRIVLCGQHETWSPHYARCEDWYKTVRATHFRSHPAGDNPTGLPRVSNWDDTALAVTLNSSVGVDAILNGISTATFDEGAMAWDITTHSVRGAARPDRRPWLEWLSWTQWHWDEIEAGKPIKHLFEDM